MTRIMNHDVLARLLPAYIAPNQRGTGQFTGFLGALLLNGLYLAGLAFAVTGGVLAGLAVFS